MSSGAGCTNGAWSIEPFVPSPTCTFPTAAILLLGMFLLGTIGVIVAVACMSIGHRRQIFSSGRTLVVILIVLSDFFVFNVFALFVRSCVYVLTFYQTENVLANRAVLLAVFSASFALLVEFLMRTFGFILQSQVNILVWTLLASTLVSAAGHVYIYTHKPGDDMRRRIEWLVKEAQREWNLGRPSARVNVMTNDTQISAVPHVEDEHAGRDVEEGEASSNREEDTKRIVLFVNDLHNHGILSDDDFHDFLVDFLGKSVADSEYAKYVKSLPVERVNDRIFDDDDGKRKKPKRKSVLMSAFIRHERRKRRGRSASVSSSSSSSTISTASTVSSSSSSSSKKEEEEEVEVESRHRSEIRRRKSKLKNGVDGATRHRRRQRRRKDDEEIVLTPREILRDLRQIEIQFYETKRVRYVARARLNVVVHTLDAACIVAMGVCSQLSVPYATYVLFLSASLPMLFVPAIQDFRESREDVGREPVTDRGMPERMYGCVRNSVIGAVVGYVFSLFTFATFLIVIYIFALEGYLAILWRNITGK